MIAGVKQVLRQKGKVKSFGQFLPLRQRVLGEPVLCLDPCLDRF